MRQELEIKRKGIELYGYSDSLHKVICIIQIQPSDWVERNFSNQVTGKEMNPPIYYSNGNFPGKEIGEIIKENEDYKKSINEIEEELQRIKTNYCLITDNYNNILKNKLIKLLIKFKFIN